MRVRVMAVPAMLLAGGVEIRRPERQPRMAMRPVHVVRVGPRAVAMCDDMVHPSSSYELTHANRRAVT
jgi:hypothetical protein